MAIEEDEEQQQSQQTKRINASQPSDYPQSAPPLPPEIIFDILMRLPAESLLLLRSVCKLWCSIVSDPHFIKSHLTFSTANINRCPHHHRLIFNRKTSSALSKKSCPLYNVLSDGGSVNNALKIDYPRPLTFASIEGSCNGLLLIANSDKFLFIWNPITRTSKKVPNFGFEWRKRYGFGYDESTDDYKVVGISAGRNDTIVEIYSLKTGNWTRIGDFHNGYPSGHNLTYLNGALHWIVSGWSHSLTILSLDLAKETYGEISQPVYDDEGGKDLRLGALGEWLCVLCNYGKIRADVWVMKVYGVKDSWTKFVSIPYHFTDLSWSSKFSVPLTILNDGKVLLHFRLKLYVYDPKSCLFSEIQNLDGCLQAFTFFGSLVSPDSPAGAPARLR